MLGSSYLAKANLDGALGQFNQAISLDAKFAAAYNLRGNAYKAKGNLNGAMADYNQAITLAPKFIDALFNRVRQSQGARLTWKRARSRGETWTTILCSAGPLWSSMRQCAVVGAGNCCRLGLRAGVRADRVERSKFL
jgi:tetratricopeptide (TPR) repeat protein